MHRVSQNVVRLRPFISTEMQWLNVIYSNGIQFNHSVLS